MRQFLALELSESTRHEIGSLAGRLSAELAGWKWTRTASVHLTLRFLGEVAADRDAAARPLWADAARSVAPFRFVLEGLGCFPSAGAPRTLWLGIREETGRLLALRDGLEDAARRVGFPAERRPFRPHLTLARARRGARAGRPDPRAAARVGQEPATRVVLVRSLLEPGGARYTALAAFALGGAGPERDARVG